MIVRNYKKRSIDSTVNNIQITGITKIDMEGSGFSLINKWIDKDSLQ